MVTFNTFPPIGARSFTSSCKHSFCISILALLGACGGGGNEPTTTTQTATAPAADTFTVVQLNPTHGSVNVPQDAALSVEFSSEVDPASINADTVILAGPQGNIEGKTVASGKQVRFEPNEGLNFSTQYTLHIKNGVKAKDGAALATTASTAFTLKQNGWSTPAMVDTGATGNAQALKTVKGFNGAVFAVWLAHDGTRNNAWASRFDAAKQAWSTPTLVEQTDLHIGSIDAAVDGQGNALAVWGQRNAADNYGNSSLQAAKFEVATQAWSTPVAIDPLISAAARLAADPAGNAWVVWEAGNNIYARYFDAAQHRWLDTVQIQSDNSGSGFVPTFALAMDEQGNSMAAWTNAATGIAFSLAQYAPAASGQWQMTNAFEKEDSFENAPLMLSADAQGNFMVAWVWSFSSPELRVSRYDKHAAAWEPAKTLAQASPIRLQQAKLDRAGNAIVLWTQPGPTDVATATAPQTLQATRFDIKTKVWAASTTLDHNIGPDTFPPHDQAGVDFDRCGNAVFVWRQFVSGNSPDISYNIMSSRYNISGNVFTPGVALVNNVLQADHLNVILPRHGKPIASWTQTDNGLKRIFSAIATP